MNSAPPKPRNLGAERDACGAHGSRRPTITGARARSSDTSVGRPRAVTLLTRLVAAFVLTTLALLPAQGEIPWRKPTVSIHADRQPADQLLRAFAAEQGIALQVAEQATMPVSGEFNGLSPRQVLDALCDASDLAWFWDGARLYIEPAANVQTKPLKFDALTPERAAAVFQSLGFESGPPSRAVTAKGTAGTFTLVGGSRFLEIAEPVLRGLDAQDKERQAQAEAQAEREADAARRRDGEMQVRVFRLKYASASDLVVQGGSSQSTVPGVARALQNVMGVSVNSLSTGSAVSERRRRVEGLRGSGLAAIGEPPAPEPAAPTRTNRSSATPEGEQERDQPLIQADPRLNAVIVRDTAARMPLYEALITQLDVSSPVIEISAAVVDLEATNDKSLGVEFLSFGDGNSSTKGRLGFEADRTFNQGDAANTGTTPAFNDGTDLVRGSGLLSSVLVPANGYQLLVRIRALEEKGDAQLVTSPSVITLENVEANLQQQETVFVRVAGREATDLFDVHAGVQLRVTPTVVREGDVISFRLVVNVQDGSFSDLLVDGVPSTRESVINTQAVVPANKTLLIGGYFVERNNNSARQVPGLGNVPILGRLFKRTDNTKSRAQRYYFITPRLVDVHHEARLNAPPAPEGKSPLPEVVTSPEKAAQRANDLASHGLPATSATVAQP